MYFERVVVETGRAAQFFDCLIDLVGDQEVQTEDIVWRLACAATVEPLAVAQLVTFPRLAGGHAVSRATSAPTKGDIRLITAYTSPVRQRSCRWTTPSTRRVADDDDRGDLAAPHERLRASTARVAARSATG
jgi:hypothetical protein